MQEGGGQVVGRVAEMIDDSGGEALHQGVDRPLGVARPDELERRRRRVSAHRQVDVLGRIEDGLSHSVAHGFGVGGAGVAVADREAKVMKRKMRIVHGAGAGQLLKGARRRQG